jgi:hypothetical protein
MGYGSIMGGPVGVVEPAPALGKRFVLRLRYGLLLKLEVGVAGALVGVAEELLAVALVVVVLAGGGLLEVEEETLEMPPFFEGENRLGSRLGSRFASVDDAAALAAWSAAAAF